MAFLIWFDSNQEEHGRNGAIETCKMLHSELSIKPSMELFEKLIAFECYSENYSKVYLFMSLLFSNGNCKELKR